MLRKAAHADSPNGGNTGYHDGDLYTYVKHLYAPESCRNQTIMLKFEGIYMNAFVYVNGQLAAKNPFGYTTFYAELNDYLQYGRENEIRVQVRAGAMTNSRWYSGAGIYRDVYLLESGLAHILPEGVQIQTENADEEYAVLQVRTELKNRDHLPKELFLETLIQDQTGKTVASDKASVVLFAQEMRKMKQRMTIEAPRLWSDGTPELYTCISRLYTYTEEAQPATDFQREFCREKQEKEAVLLDENREAFGIRTIQADAKRGLRVNGNVVKLRGACIHHDSGLLGAATYEEAQYRQIRLLKEAGFNAVRMSHHPMAPAMLRACDVLGMYVMDEMSDMWNRLKSDYDYGLYFQEWWEKDVTAMVKKDYNHPSVILYSVGNEIPEIGTDHGAKTCHDLCAKIRELDDTRFTLASINGVFAAGDQVDRIVADVAADLAREGKADGNVNDFMTLMDDHMDEIVVHDAITERLEKACAALDIVGYNYMTARYEPDRRRYPNRIIVGSETYPPEIARNWSLVESLPNVIGDFTWTGWDYIGEAGIGIPGYQWGEGGFGAAFPAQLAYCGDLDITGFRRPASYYREIVFGLRKEPYIAVQDPNRYGQTLIKTPWVISDTVSTWTWQGCEGKPVVVEVYAPGTEAELFVNGKSAGRRPSGKAVGYRTLFETIYEPGTVEAVVYENGMEISRTELKTAGGLQSLVLKREPYYGPMDAKQTIAYLSVEIRDSEGILVTDHDQKITLQTEGSVKAVGFGSANPKPKYNFNEGVTETFLGRAMVILMKNGEGECARINISAEDGMHAESELHIPVVLAR